MRYFEVGRAKQTEAAARAIPGKVAGDNACNGGNTAHDRHALSLEKTP
jgi:hypothetical protein